MEDEIRLVLARLSHCQLRTPSFRAQVKSRPNFFVEAMSSSDIKALAARDIGKTLRFKFLAFRKTQNSWSRHISYLVSPNERQPCRLVPEDERWWAAWIFYFIIYWMLNRLQSRGSWIQYVAERITPRKSRYSVSPFKFIPLHKCFDQGSASRYFTKDDHHGVCIFRRRKTTEHGHRGFRLSSLGILLAKSPRPRPWRHVPALKTLIQNIYDNIEGRGMLEMIDNDLEPARVFFETHKTRLPIGEAEDWNGWSQELDGVI